MSWKTASDCHDAAGASLQASDGARCGASGAHLRKSPSSAPSPNRRSAHPADRDVATRPRLGSCSHARTHPARALTRAAGSRPKHWRHPAAPAPLHHPVLARQALRAASTSSSIFFASPNSIRLFSL